MGELPFALRDKVGVARDYAIGRNRYIGYLISLATRSYDGILVWGWTVPTEVRLTLCKSGQTPFANSE